MDTAVRDDGGKSNAHDRGTDTRIGIKMVSYRTVRRAGLTLLLWSVIGHMPAGAQNGYVSPLEPVLIDYDRFVTETIENWGIPGAAVAVVEDGQIMHIRGYGVRATSSPETVDAHTVFRLASVSKGFASVLAGMLVEEGVLDWDDRIVDYVPTFQLKDPRATRRVTVRHVLSHTTGLPQHAYTNLIEANISYPRMLKELKECDLIGPVGTTYGYQNVAFSVIGDVIEAATGRTYEDLVRERIFGPLFMTDASIGWEGLQSSENRARPHLRRGYRWRPTRDKKAYYSVPPSAGVNASITDMTGWLLALMGERPDLLPQRVLDTIYTPIVRTQREMRRYRWGGRVRDTHYALGWRIFDYRGHTLVYHSGGIQGYLAQMGFLPEYNVGIVVLQNSRRIDFLIPEFFDTVLELYGVH